MGRRLSLRGITSGTLMPGKCRKVDGSSDRSIASLRDLRLGLRTSACDGNGLHTCGIRRPRGPTYRSSSRRHLYPVGCRGRTACWVEFRRQMGKAAMSWSKPGYVRSTVVFFVRARAYRAPFSSQFIQDGVEELLTQSFHINVAPMATTNDLSFSSSRRPSLSGETHNPRRVNSDSIVPQSLGAGPR